MSGEVRANRLSPTTDKALGDLNADGFVDLFDLLRLRDITLGSPPTVYEQQEGDLDGNTRVDHADVIALRGALIGVEGLPHVIDQNGGDVVGNRGRTTFTIPPGSFDRARRVAVENYPRDVFEADFGLQSATWPQDAFLAGARLVLLDGGFDESFPAGISFTEAAPVDAVMDSAGNSAFTIAPDADGDGVPELVLLGDLILEDAPESTGSSASAHASRQAAYRPSAAPRITGLHRSVFDPAVGSFRRSPDSVTRLESGMFLEIEGTGWDSAFPSDYRVEAVAGADTIALNIVDFIPTVPAGSAAIRGAVVALGFLGSTGVAAVELRVRNLLTGVASSQVVLSVSQPSVSFYPDLDERLIVYYNVLKTAVSSDLLDPELRSRIGPSADSLLATVVESIDSLLSSIRTLPHDASLELAKAQAVRFFENWQLDDHVGITANAVLSDPPCGLSGWDRLGVTWLLGVNALSCVGASQCARALPASWVLWQCWAMAGMCYGSAQATAAYSCAVLDEWEECLAEKCPPQVRAGGQQIRSSTFRGVVNGRVVCLHVDCAPIPGLIRPIIHRACTFPFPFKTNTRSRDDLSGLVVKVKNALLPVSAAMTTRTGRFVIPFNYNSGDVVLTAYDPRTGLFDDDLTTLAILDPENGVHPAFGSLFDPDTTAVYRTVHPGEVVEGTIDGNISLWFGRFYAAPGDVDRKLRFGMRSTNALTFILRNPAGVTLYANGGTANCVSRTTVDVQEAGTYTITIGRGNNGQLGDFALGMNFGDSPVIPYLCGPVYLDRLTADYSPYRVFDPAYLTQQQILSLDPGVSIVFSATGDLRGGLQGTAAPGLPIVLLPDGTVPAGVAGRAP